jgi:hypothetical protein
MVRRYHDATNHRPGRPSSTPYGLDWRNEPGLLKRYPDLEPVRPPDELGRVLRLGAGVHPRRGDPHFRTFMSAGALHPIELYVATKSWLAHYHPGEGTLRRLRDKDTRAALARAASAPELAEAAAVLVLTGILWRTAWKYGAGCGVRTVGRARISLSVTAPPAFRITGASPSSRSSTRVGIKRASMQATTATFLGTEEIILIHHTDCGMLTFTDDEFRSRLQEETGIRPEWARKRSATWTRTSASASADQGQPFHPTQERARFCLPRRDRDAP